MKKIKTVSQSAKPTVEPARYLGGIVRYVGGNARYLDGIVRYLGGIVRYSGAVVVLFCLLSLAACGSGADSGVGTGSGSDGGSDADANTGTASETRSEESTTQAGAEQEITKYEDTGFVMGTVLITAIYSSGDNITPEITDLLSETENEYISWRIEDAEIAAINQNAGSNKPTEVSDKTREYIAGALSIGRKSSGAFDVTIGNVSRLWDFDNEKNVVPDDAEIQSLLKNVDYNNIKLQGNTVEMEKGTSIDLGAIGKGIGCDEIEAYLEGNEEVKGLLVNIGGSSTITYGDKGTGEPWKVAVLDPRDDAGYLGVLALEGTHHISTSADYEKYFEKDGKRYHHILDPSTGYPADSGLISTTIVANKGAISDGLSTACFVLGKEKAMKLLEAYDAEGIFVDQDKNVYITDGLRDKFELLADGYHLV